MLYKPVEKVSSHPSGHFAILHSWWVPFECDHHNKDGDGDEDIEEDDEGYQGWWVPFEWSWDDVIYCEGDGDGVEEEDADMMKMRMIHHKDGGGHDVIEDGDEEDDEGYQGWEAISSQSREITL